MKLHESLQRVAQLRQLRRVGIGLLHDRRQAVPELEERRFS